MCFTDAALRSIKRPKVPTIYWDGDKPEEKIAKAQAGLHVLVNPSGKITFRSTFQLNGKFISRKLGTFDDDLSLADARKMTEADRVNARKGIDPRKEREVAQEASSNTYGKVVDQFIELYAKSGNGGGKKPSAS